MGEDEIKKELIFQILLVILVAMVGWQMTTLHRISVQLAAVTAELTYLHEDVNVLKSYNRER